jgi:hypothetical protein
LTFKGKAKMPLLAAPDIECANTEQETGFQRSIPFLTSKHSAIAPIWVASQTSGTNDSTVARMANSATAVSLAPLPGAREGTYAARGSVCALFTSAQPLWIRQVSKLV